MYAPIHMWVCNFSNIPRLNFCSSCVIIGMFRAPICFPSDIMLWQDTSGVRALPHAPNYPFVINSLASVRKRTIPTERQPLVSEVSANFFADRGATWSESLRPYSRLSRPDPLLFIPSSSSVVLTRLSGPRSRPITFFFL
jgi:hypothetical protein